MNHANPGSSPALATLHPGQTHVWFLRTGMTLPSGIPAVGNEKWLSPDERQRARRFVFDHDRQQFIASRVVLRRVLSLYSPVSPDQWSFATGRWGKPFVEQPAESRWLRFNLTHTRGLLVVAVAREQEVGVDAEWIGRPVEWQSIAAGYFSPAELTLLRSAPEAQALTAFFRLWTLKEACIKAFGQGLTVPLETVCFDSLDSDQPQLRPHAGLPASPCQWDIHVLDDFSEHCVAVVVERAAPRDLLVRDAARLFGPENGTELPAG